MWKVDIGMNGLTNASGGIYSKIVSGTFTANSSNTYVKLGFKPTFILYWFGSNMCFYSQNYDASHQYYAGTGRQAMPFGVNTYGLLCSIDDMGFYLGLDGGSVSYIAMK